MRKDTQAVAHVELPQDVGRTVVFKDLCVIWTTVLAIAETLYVETTELALGGDVVQPVPFHIRRTCRRRQQELSQPSLYSRSYVLPQECALLRVKCHEHAGLLLVGGVHVPCVVRAHIDGIASHHGATISFVSQLDTPDDVPTGGRIPVDWRIARVDGCRREWGREGRRRHDVRRDRLCR